jgi:hypothetical protein
MAVIAVVGTDSVSGAAASGAQPARRTPPPATAAPFIKSRRETEDFAIVGSSLGAKPLCLVYRTVLYQTIALVD